MIGETRKKTFLKGVSILFCLFFAAAVSWAGPEAESIEDENTSIERSDVHSLDEIAQPWTSIENEATQPEMEDDGTVDQANQPGAMENDQPSTEENKGRDRGN